MRRIVRQRRTGRRCVQSDFHTVTDIFLKFKFQLALMGFDNLFDNAESHNVGRSRILSLI